MNTDLNPMPQLKHSPWGIFSIITFVLAVGWLTYIMFSSKEPGGLEIFLMVLLMFFLPIIGLVVAIIGKRNKRYLTNTAKIGFWLNIYWLLLIAWMIFMIQTGYECDSDPGWGY